MPQCDCEFGLDILGALCQRFRRNKSAVKETVRRGPTVFRP